MVDQAGFSGSGTWTRRGLRGVRPPSVSAALLPMLALRFAGHLPYFKIGSGLVLPHGLSLGGAAVTALAYSLLCLVVARWLTGAWARHSLQRPIAASLAGTLAIGGAMLLLGPLITLLLPGDPAAAASHLADEAEGWRSLMPAYLGLLIPVCLGFFAAQSLARVRTAAALRQAIAEGWTARS